MVVEDYLPFLISEIYLQDMDLLSYPHHRPLERVNWVFPFWADARGYDASLGLPLFWGPVDGRLFSNPIKLKKFPKVNVSISDCIINFKNC